MTGFVDGYYFPIKLEHLDEYASIAGEVAAIWRSYGALAYFENVLEDRFFDGTRSFVDVGNISKDETIIFGWIIFESRQSRDKIHQLVANDPGMAKLVAPLIDPSRFVFEAEKMVYGGFQPIVAISNSEN